MIWPEDSWGYKFLDKLSCFFNYLVFTSSDNPIPWPFQPFWSLKSPLSFSLSLSCASDQFPPFLLIPISSSSSGRQFTRNISNQKQTYKVPKSIPPNPDLCILRVATELFIKLQLLFFFFINKIKSEHLSVLIWVDGTADCNISVCFNPKKQIERFPISCLRRWHRIYSGRTS